jgi:VWFA-related protein
MPHCRIEMRMMAGHTLRRLEAVRRGVAAVLIAGLLVPALPAQNAQQGRSGYTFRATSELVLVNVVVRDKNGTPVKGLTRDDFTIVEDGKPQTVSTFDYEDIPAGIAAASAAGPSQAMVLGAKPSTATAAPAPPPEALRDRRLIVLFFDLTGMEPDEVDRTATAALKYVDEQMTPADLVALVSLSTRMQVEQDFTSDKELLKKALAKFSLSAGAGYTNGMTADTEGTSDDANSYTPDETEYNVFNTDRKLEALGSLAQSLSKVDQKKSIIYFSNGVQQTGQENQAELRTAVNEAIKANVAIYTVDMRGLQALPPGGEARNASLRGTSIYSGASQRNALDANFASQETLQTLAGDTGGKAFLDSNDFGKVFRAVQNDTSQYYLLGYRSSNTARDGRYRRIAVKLKNQGYKLEYRSGYYAPRDFQHSTHDDREQQLMAELSADFSATDLNMYLGAAYFRVDDAHFFVPVSVVIPGTEIPFTRDADKDKATLDFAGLVRDESKRVVANTRDTIKLNVEGAQEVRRKNVQYRTGFTLPPGKYHLKFVARENQTGRIGSFETDVVIPDLRKVPLRLSSVLVGNQLQQVSKPGKNPLVHDGQELVPSVTHVFSANQKLYFYYEVYEPAKMAEPAKSEASKHPIRLLTNIAFYNGKLKIYETPLVEARELNTPERKAAVFQFEVPLSQLRPGFYACQINVVDDAGGTFAFPRVAVLVRPAATAANASSPGGK